MTDSYDVAVVGGGIAGLTAALRLAQAGARVVLLEERDDVGGMIKSEVVDGRVLELGPNTMAYREGDALHRLISEVGLGDKLVSVAAREVDRYIWHNGRLRKAPLSPMQGIISDMIPLKAKLRAGLGMLMKKPTVDEGTTVGGYFRERIGREAVELILQPAMSGIFAADVDRMGMAAAMPRMHSRLRGIKAVQDGVGARRIGTFEAGLQELPRALAEKAREAGVDVRLGCGVKGLKRVKHAEARSGEIKHTIPPPEGGGKQKHLEGSGVDWWRLGLSSEFRLGESGQSGDWRSQEGRCVEARQVVLTGSAEAAAELLGDVAEVKVMQSLPYAPLVVVHAWAPVGAVEFKRRGFGFLAALGHGVRSLGILWPDRVFEGGGADDKRMFTCFIGGELDPEAVKLSDEELLELVRGDLELTMGARRDAVELARVTRRAKAMPLYHSGHLDKLREIESKVPVGVHLLSSFQGGPSLYDRVCAAEHLARKIAEKL